ncbi:AER292Cp [Eremothecium gossypii ATCC 10895]|uniref:AER292Cp n=1 Tax=Eremothecium gossypii (strain ATCC 10895 / CBS 109.51 / FGSC 9923 / NRRL Y-1056) TaxID=284811 RepID=Q756H4_EREGS|nr:AER292Cp [Eremothecium gossypii ATCC 10895]AAS52973.1 AER292Cp [Eremothecium gossypii ATCC 10895]
MLTAMDGNNRDKRVAIVGAGPAGLAAARVLLANTKLQVTVFEQAPQIGGVWYYNDGDKESAMYDHLETNLPKQIMAYSGFPFPDYDSVFPPRTRVLEYLLLYYRAFVEGRAQMCFNTQVTSLEKIIDKNKWQVITSMGKKSTFDYVVVANGHFRTPNLPDDIPGWAEWAQLAPHASIHSTQYTNCAEFRDKTVVVVGNGSSGVDIANQISSVAGTVYHSVRDPSKASWPPESPIRVVGAIQNMDAARRTLYFQHGQVVPDVDQVIWATGFRFHFPFLKSYRGVLFPEDSPSGVTRICGLWEHLIFAEDPTLAFPLLNQGVVTFPLAESHACLIAQVFSGRIPREQMPPVETSAGKSVMSPDDVLYYRHINEILLAHGGEQDPFRPVIWDDKMLKLRIDGKEAKTRRNFELVHRSLNLRKLGLPYSL